MPLTATANPPPLNTTFSAADRNRQSLVSNGSQLSSSASSFRTAPLAAPTPTSRSSSSQTLGKERESDTINPIHTLAGTQEVHIVRVTSDKVHLESGPLPDGFLQRVGKHVSHAVNGRQEVPVFPPSPPASVDEREGYTTPTPPAPSPSTAPQSYSEPLQHSSSPILIESLTTSTHTVVHEEPRPMTLEDRQLSTGSSSRDVRFAQPVHDTKQRTSTEARVPSIRSAGRSGRPGDEVSVVEASGVDSSKQSTSTSPDGHLLPPQMSAHRPTRRNTTGSARPLIPAPTVPQRMGTNRFSTQYGYEDGDLADEGLASDIQAAAEQIRRERVSKRAKQQQEAEAEAALTRSQTSGKKDKDDANGVLVGNLIGEDHVNYVMMYNMLTGLRIGVSRCQAKMKRPLTDEDFHGAHKYSFDIIGNELTPSAKYDFKFKDYASWVFRELREDYFQLDPADYLVSLTSKYILSELGSPGKSGSFFYFSRDYKFIIKTIRHSEAKFLLSILKQYHAHVKSNPHTLLSRFYGLHRVKLPRGRKIHFVVMNNLFPPHRDIHETYDLKGSTVGREYPEDKAKQNPHAVLKDINWIDRGKILELGPEKRAFLTEQLRRDAEFLKSIGVMDYSLLVGIHNMQRGNRDNVRRNTLKVFSPAIPMRRRATQQNKGATSHEAAAMRRVMRESDPQRLGMKGTIRLPEQDTGDRQQFIFYQDEGGLQATDEQNEAQADPGAIYYLGIIDILTPYTTVKKLEHLWKGAQHDRHKISPVPPGEYADRFFSFMKAVMRGGEGGGRFKPS